MAWGWRRAWVAALLAVTFLGLGGPAAPGGVAFAREGDCLSCHGQSLSTTYQGQSLDLRIDPAAFAASPHGSSGCAYCHTAPVHAPLDQVRAAALKTCGSCHRNYDFSGATGRFVEVGQPGAALPGTGRPGAVPSGVTATALFIHPDPPLTCGSCHGSIHAVVAAADAASPLNRANAVSFCGSCHRAQTDAYYYSYHGSAYRLGSRTAPVCTNCHGHLPPVSADPAAPTSKGGAAVCAKCHIGGSPSLARLQESGMEHVTPVSRAAGVDGLSRWAVWKFFLLVILLNATKDGLVIVTDLTRRLRRAGPGGRRAWPSGGKP